jgi:hypothetical protein
MKSTEFRFSAAVYALCAFAFCGCAAQGAYDQQQGQVNSAAMGGLMGSMMAASPRPAPAAPQAAPSATAMHQAAASGGVEQLESLIDRGGDVDARLPYPQDDISAGMTPLMSAAKADQLDCVRLLLERGASVDAKSNMGWIAGTFANHFQASAAVKALLHEAYVRKHPAAATASAAQSSAAPAAAPNSDVDAPAAKAGERPDDYALVVGIEKYSRLPDARYAEHDADSVKSHLLALGYPERNIILLKGEQATRGPVQGYVEEWLPRNTKPDSRVFVYFSGHGSPDPKNGDAYLVPWDGDAMFLKSTAYPLKSLYASLARLKAKRVVVALDSCFSGAGGRSVLASGARPLVSHVDTTDAPAGVTVLSAASGDEITGTLDDQGHGAFTYYLLKAFNHGSLTVKAAYAELKPKVEDSAHRQNREQTPLMIGDDAPF